MSGVMNASLLSGGALALMDRFDAAAALALIRRTRTTGVMGAPQMFVALVREARRVGAAPPLRFAMAGGAALATGAGAHRRGDLRLRAARRLRHERGRRRYHPDAGRRRRPGRVRSVPRCRAASCASSISRRGAPLPVGDPGEVAVRSPSVMRGYRADDEATRAVVDPDGWLSTGDVGYLDRRRLPVPGGPKEGAHHPLRIQRVSARGRGGAVLLPGRARGGGGGHPGRRARRRGGRAGRPRAAGRPGSGGGEGVRARAARRVQVPAPRLRGGELPKGPTGKVSKRDIDRQALRARL